MNIENYAQQESKNTVELDKEPGLQIGEGMKEIPVDNAKSKEEQVSNSDVQVNPSDYETLDESKRDGRAIFHKLKHVLLPRFSATKADELQNWDLWGPLIFCILLCCIISICGNTTTDSSNVFIVIFVIFWIGGFIVTLNCQFLGAKINFLQSICLLGYCIFPIDIAALLIRIIPSANFVKLIIVGVTFSSVGFISGMVTQEKKMVAVYPVFLFFLVLSWFVLTL